MTKVSLIIPSRNRVDGLLRSLDNMRATTQGRQEV